MFTKNGKALSAKGVKPICPFQQVFKSTYLFGAFSPVNGNKFLLEMPFCNTDTFQSFLNEFSEYEPEEFKIMVLDNGAFHKTKSLTIPKNICLVFLPPYSPELNPAEKMWAILKRNFTNQLFNSLEQIGEFISNEIKSISPLQTIKTCNYEYVFVQDIWTTL
jgi:transposase